jgi:uncharacterized surface protein with fasciclin (FAS1) repeats
VAIAACTLLIGASVMQSCKDEDHEVLTGQPSWLGNSIYERLQEDGNYTYMLRLIDDLGQTDVLRQTGSKSIFPADDNAFNEWFSTNQWGVRSYDQLSMARKKLMLNNAMINNAYLIALMSNVSGNPPEEGKAMRRLTATSIYDSVYLMPVEKMPETSYWSELRKRGKKVPMFLTSRGNGETMGHAAPMIHFLPSFMRVNKITGEDLKVLTNGVSNSIADAWINGKKVIESDITCKNGYIHKVSGVVESSPNMAEIVRMEGKAYETTKWSKLMDRFSAPFYTDDGTKEYNRIFQKEDSAFILRYANKQDAVMYNGQQSYRLPDGSYTTEMLAFDPGKNSYMYTNTMGYDLHYDAGALIVPTDNAVDEWWNGDGRDLKDEYNELDSVPTKTLAKLLNVNMLSSFLESVPSKFGQVLNDAKEELGIKPENVVACYMGCNGVVYIVDKVFAPAEYASVAYPALAHEKLMNVIYWAIDNRGFLPYLLSMDAEYAFLLPTNNAMLNYIDPASYGLTPVLLEYATDPSMKRTWATRYSVTINDDGTLVKGVQLNEQLDKTDKGLKIVNTQLDDLLNQLIIVLPEKGKKVENWLADKYRYFKTKGGTILYAEPGANGKPAFAGGWQREYNTTIPTQEVYTKSNGSSYQIDTQVPLGAQRSLYMTLKEHPEYTNFLKILKNDYADLFSVALNKKYKPSSTENQNFTLFDNYNYTVFVPTNASIEQLQADKVLPTWRELEFTDTITNIENGIIDSIIVANHWDIPGKGIDDKLRDSVTVGVRKAITDFVRYHVQDHAVAVGMVPEPNMTGHSYESMLRNPETGRFFKLQTKFGTIEDDMTVTDVWGTKHTVVKTDGLYNNMVREYWFEGSLASARLFMGSDAMVHLIDGPLAAGYTQADGTRIQWRKWTDVVKDYLKR